MKALIIEDEPFAQQELKDLIAHSASDIQVVDCIDSVEDAVEWLQNNPMPELIFCDIQLADGLSFEIFKQVEVVAPVIFTTAFNEYAIEAFMVNSIDYLLKPFAQDDLNRALEKLSKLQEKPQVVSNDVVSQIEELMAKNRAEVRYKSRYLVKFGDEIKFVNTSEIAYFYAEDNEVLIRCLSGKRYIIDYSLEQINQELDPNVFFRLNRTYLANIESVKRIHKYLNSRLKIELIPETDENVLVSRARVPEFLNWIER